MQFLRWTSRGSSALPSSPFTLRALPRCSIAFTLTQRYLTCHPGLGWTGTADASHRPLIAPSSPHFELSSSRHHAV